MTLVSVGGSIELPYAWESYTPNCDSFSTTLDADGEKAGAVFHAPKSGDIAAIGFRVNAVTAWDDLKAGIETVNSATGYPTGTAKGGCVPGTTADSDANEWKWVTLDTAASAVIEGVGAAADMSAHPFGTGIYKTEISGAVASGNNFVTHSTESPTERCALGLLADQFDDGTGGSGGLLMANKRGNKQ